MCTTYEFKDLQFITDPIFDYDIGSFASKCIVIDNGSHSCRAGWSTEPQPKLVYRNLISKLRGKKESEGGNHYFGNDIKDLEDLKWNIRTQFDSNVVTNFDIQETAFDYMFSHLGLNGKSSIDHPVCITEAVGIPNTSRQFMSEILFECYNIPKLAYGIDGLFSLHHNLPSIQYGIVINCGYQVTHVLPYVKGKSEIGCSKRLNLGGLNMMILARRLLQLQHPNHALVINLSRTQELLMNHCYMALDYKSELKKWKDSSYKEKNKVNIQVPVLNTATEKDLEMKKIQARRLKDINQKKREEKIKADEEQLAKLNAVRGLESSNSSLFKTKIKDMNLKSENELNDLIKDIVSKIESRKSKAKKYFEEIKNESCDSKMSKADNASIDDIEKVLRDLEEEKLSLYDKRRSAAMRKQALSKRKSYASKERMRILSQLAKGGSMAEKLKKEDTFGMKDEDWDVYKFINKNGSDSEDEQNQERLNEVEQSISHYQLLLSKLIVGCGQKYQYLSFDAHQHRIPEILYQPSMNGLDQEGIAGMISSVMRNYDLETQNKLIENIFVTGGPTLLPGFKERLEAELMALLPFRASFSVKKADNALLDGWKGAAALVNEQSFSSDIFMTSNDYHENGSGYLKEHKCSNSCIDLQ